MEAPSQHLLSSPVSSSWIVGEAERVKGTSDARLAFYATLPSYRTGLDREGATGPADVSLVGDEGTVRKRLERFADAGATDFSAVEFATNDEEAQRTRDLLRAIVRGWLRQPKPSSGSKT